jgi:hypothetical protein|tara:strand:- start:11 stop:427 length:417 start_codon:yes stop_codon:yes gene_type:complete
VINFKTFYEKNKPLGLIETIEFEELGPIEAKVDSGNGAYNVLHGTDIEVSGDQVTFSTVNNQREQKDLIETIDINIGSGVIENRPVVQYNIKIGDKEYPNTKFSIGDRSSNEYKILLGKDFIEELGGLIDVSAENNLD